MTIYPSETVAAFGVNYPEIPHKLTHELHNHPLLELEALAQLAERLPQHCLECNLGDQPVGVVERPEQLLDEIGDRIRNIDSAASWVALREVEQDPLYARLLEEVLAELRPSIERRTGTVFNIQGYIFTTSPGAVTPYHFDPEHNILLQLRGRKTMTVFPAGDTLCAADERHEIYHRGGGPELPWQDEIEARGSPWSLAAGEALYVPVMAPHFVRNGPETSISLSVTWRSEWSYAEADARAFNAVLRRAGMRPRAPGRWPATNRAKALAWRALRKTGLSKAAGGAG